MWKMSNFEFAKLKPEAAIKFFEQKGYALGFDWRDVWKEEHAIAFTVAKATSLDILTDIRSEIDKALKNGETFESFKENLYPKLAEKGWWGKKLQTDPLTGEVKQVQLGSVKRLQTIYYTNIDMAYSAGMWDEIEQTKKLIHICNIKTLMAEPEQNTELGMRFCCRLMTHGGIVIIPPMAGTADVG